MSRRELDAALRKVQPQWSDARAASTQRGVVRKQRRRRIVRVSVAAAVLLGVVAVGVRISSPAPVTETPVPIAEAPVVPPKPPPPSFEISAEGTRPPTLVEGVLVAGRVKVRGTGSLKAGPVEIVVSASQVLVDRTDVTTVTVIEGEAVVRWDGQDVRLQAGDVRTFPPQPAQPSEPTRRPTPKPVAKWKQLAEEGDFATAWVELSKAQPPKDEPAELLLAADVARLSKHPQEAVTPLRRVLTRFPNDPRAPLAAFTLGRTLLDELGRPAEAAQAFSKARVLQPDGPLVPDALAREVEAEARAGNAGRAHTLALEYLQRYPEGARARLVRHHGGIE